MNCAARSSRVAAISVFMAMSTAGCLLGPEHYYGTYTVTCTASDAAAVRDETQRVANLASKQLGQPLLPVASNPGDVTLHMSAPPTSSVAFYFDVTSPKNFEILISA